MAHKQIRTLRFEKIEIKRDKAEFINEFYKEPNYIGKKEADPENPEYHRLLAAYAQYFGSPLTLKEILFFQKTSNPILFTEWYCETKFVFCFFDKPILRKPFTYWWLKGATLFWPLISLIIVGSIMLFSEIVNVLGDANKSLTITAVFGIIFCIAMPTITYIILLQVDIDASKARGLNKRLENEKLAIKATEKACANDSNLEVSFQKEN